MFQTSLINFIAVLKSSHLFTLENNKIQNEVQWRIQDFPEGGVNPPGGGVNTPNFPENCMKSKEFGRPGGACVPHAPPPRSANEVVSREVH